MDACNTTWPRNVWTLADKANTTNDEGNVDEIDDYQPQLYAATLALLAANNGNEVEELQRRAKERVAYDYAGGGMCENAALYPAWMQERQAQCNARTRAAELFSAEGSDGFNSGSVMHRLNNMQNVTKLPAFDPLGPPGAGPASTQYGSPTLLDWQGLPPKPPASKFSPPSFTTLPPSPVLCPFTGQPCPYAAAGMNCGCMAAHHRGGYVRAATANKTAKPQPHVYQKMRDLPKKLSNSVRGAFYDMRHWKHLPTVASGETGTTTIKYVLTRDDRMSYLLMSIALIFFIIAFISALSASSKN
jgi:hypothetical protein